MLHGLISEATCILTFYNGLVSEASYISVLKIRDYVYINSVMLTSLALPQVRVCCGLIVMCSPLHTQRAVH